MVMDDSGIGICHHGLDVWRVSLRGEHDLSTTAELEAVLDDLGDQRIRIVLDLSEATFIDSSILGVIVRASRRSGEEKFGVVLLEGSFPERVAGMIGLERAATIYPDVESALVELGVEPEESAGAVATT